MLRQRPPKAAMATMISRINFSFMCEIVSQGGKKMKERKFWMVANSVVWAVNVAGAAFAAWLWIGGIG